MLKKLFIITAIILSHSVLFAADKYLEVDSFEGVDLGTGMVSEVQCGSTNSVTLIGATKDLERIKVQVKSGELRVKRNSSAGSFIKKIFNSGENHEVKVDIVIANRLSSIELSTGATISVPDCAVNTDYLDLDLSTGASATVSGYTKKLNLELSTGAEFNRRGGSFKVDEAKADLSTGATANLCGAGSVQGDASTGATLSVADSIDRSGIDLSLGAEATSYRCK